uniref:DUF3860 domain-containing protein n=1 Tax=Ascaris lumbricoides TaxID=6252 RepID=A0A0M3ITH5_ASCLU
MRINRDKIGCSSTANMDLFEEMWRKGNAKKSISIVLRIIAEFAELNCNSLLHCKDSLL